MVGCLCCNFIAWHLLFRSWMDKVQYTNPRYISITSAMWIDRASTEYLFLRDSRLQSFLELSYRLQSIETLPISQGKDITRVNLYHLGIMAENKQPVGLLFDIGGVCVRHSIKKQPKNNKLLMTQYRLSLPSRPFWITNLPITSPQDGWISASPEHRLTAAGIN